MPHIKTPPIGRDEIVNKIVISKNYLATKKRYFTVFDNMKSEIALAPRKIEEQKLVYQLFTPCCNTPDNYIKSDFNSTRRGFKILRLR